MRGFLLDSVTLRMLRMGIERPLREGMPAQKEFLSVYAGYIYPVVFSKLLFYRFQNMPLQRGTAAAQWSRWCLP